MKKGDLVKLSCNFSSNLLDADNSPSVAHRVYRDPRCQPGIVVGLRGDIIGIYWEAVSDVEWWFKEVLEKINET